MNLNSDEIDSLVRSSRIPDAVKRAVFDNLDAFVTRLDARSATSIADYAVSIEAPTPIAKLLQLVEAQAAPESIAGVLGINVATISDQELLALLKRMGDEYAKLAEANGTAPKVRRTRGFDEILARLRSLGIAGQDVGLDDGLVRVYMKHAR